MSAGTVAKSPEMPLTHAALALGLLVAVLLAGEHLIPRLLEWPYYLLVPLAVYFLVVWQVAPLRRSLTCVRIGRLDSAVWLATLLVIVIASVSLLIWYVAMQPDVSLIVMAFPRGPLPLMLLAGVGFSLFNALLEEILFRGLLFDALKASYGVVAALLIQAGLFGGIHLYGFPSGALGVALASIYGVMQGSLCLYTGGLGACWVAHVFADATIFVLLLPNMM